MAVLRGVEYLRSMIRLVSRELRERSPRHPLRGERVMIERSDLRVEPRRLAAYLKTTSGTGIERFRGGDAVLPPIFPATWEATLAIELLCHSRAPSVRGGVVHVGSELVQVRPLRADDTLCCRMELDRVEQDERGVRLHLLTRTWNGSGQLGCESRTTLLARGRRSPAARSEKASKGSAAADTPGDDGLWDELAHWRLRSNHGRRYARASGDFNPIHLSRLTALPFGFRRPILHGFCIEALVAHSLIEHRFGGEPERLRRLRIAFRSPLLLPADVRLLLTRTAASAGRFEVTGREEKTFAEGEFAGG
jgi:acyl dehydratase